MVVFSSLQTHWSKGSTQWRMTFGIHIYIFHRGWDEPSPLQKKPVCVVLCLVAQSCLTLCNPMDYSPPGSSVLGDSPGKNTGVGCHSLLQGIFPTQGSNPGLPHCRRILYWLSHQGSPYLDLSPPRRGPTPDTFDPANFWQAISWHLAAL